MPLESARARAMSETRERILDVALEVLGQNPDAGMGDIAAAAGVVRRTVYGYFPTRTDLVLTLAERAADEIAGLLREVDAPGSAAEEVWVDFIARLWPLADRYRVLLALRRGEYGQRIHVLLEPVDELLAGLVKRGQESEAFGRHLPPAILSQLAYAAVFSLADNHLTDPSLDARVATLTSLLLLGVSEPSAAALTRR